MQIPDWLHHALAIYGYWIVLLSVAIESTGIPFPGETALLAGAAYAGTGGRLNIVGVIIAAAAGAILGDNAGYAIGRFGGYPLINRLAKIIHLNPKHLEQAQRYFEKHGDKTVFFGRFFALLRAWAAFLAGVNKMHWRSFLIWNAAGGITWATIFGILGYVLGTNLPLLGVIMRDFGIGGLIVLGALVVGALIYWRYRSHRAEREPQPTAQPTTQSPSARAISVRAPVSLASGERPIATNKPSGRVIHSPQRLLQTPTAPVPLRSVTRRTRARMLRQTR